MSDYPQVASLQILALRESCAREDRPKVGFLEGKAAIMSNFAKAFYIQGNQFSTSLEGKLPKTKAQANKKD